MKTFLLISVCILSMTFAGSAATSNSVNGKTPAKKEAVVAKKDAKKAPLKKTTTKKVTATPVTPASPMKK